MEFVTDTAGGANYLKPADYANAKALLLEVKRYDANQPDPFNEGATRNEATADITIFTSADTLSGSEKPVVLPNAKITATVLARDLESLVGKAAIYRIDKAGRAWVWRAVDPAIAEQVIAYAEGKSAPADDDMPDFTSGAPF